MAKQEALDKIQSILDTYEESNGNTIQVGCELNFSDDDSTKYIGDGQLLHPYPNKHPKNDCWLLLLESRQ